MLRLVFPYPVSANRYWRSFAYLDKATRKPRSVTVPSDEAKAYKTELGWIAKQAGFRSPTTKPIALAITLCPRENKDGSASGVVLDLSNCMKVAEDALQGVVYVNDKQVRRLALEYGAAVKDGALLVDVEEFVQPSTDLLAGVPIGARVVHEEAAVEVRKDGLPF